MRTASNGLFIPRSITVNTPLYTHCLPLILSPVKRWPWSKHALYDNKSAHHISRKTCCQRTKHLSLLPVPHFFFFVFFFFFQWVYSCSWNNSRWSNTKTPLIYIRVEPRGQGCVCLIKQRLYAFPGTKEDDVQLRSEAATWKTARRKGR